MGALEEAIRENSRAVGFSLVGIAPATPADDFALYQAWVADGFADNSDLQNVGMAVYVFAESVVVPEGVGHFPPEFLGKPYF